MDEELSSRNLAYNDQTMLCNSNCEHTIISALPHEQLTCTKPSDITALTQIINDKTQANARADVMEQDRKPHQERTNYPDNKTQTTWAVTNNGTGSSTLWRIKKHTHQNNNECPNDQYCLCNICDSGPACHSDTGSDQSDTNDTDSDTDLHHNSHPDGASGHHHLGSAQY